MNRIIQITCVFLSLCLVASTAFAAEAKQVDATVEFSATNINVGFGSTDGQGTLFWKNHKIPFTIKGMNIGKAGVSKIEGTGSVYGLKNLEDFNGRFFSKSVNATVGIGGGAATLSNNKGVKINATSKSKGLDIGLTLSDPRFTLDPEVVAQVMAKEQRAEYVGPKITDSVKALASICGCPVYMNVAWSTYQSDPASNKRRVAYAVDEFVSAASDHCSDLKKRKNFCENIAQVDVAFNEKQVATIGRDGDVLSIVLNERGKLSPTQIADALIGQR